MHGIIHVEWKNFVVERFGLDGWNAVAEDAGLASRFFLPQAKYPDSELVQLVQATAHFSREEPQKLLEAFGFHLAGALLSMYGALLQPEWGTLDIVEHTEGTIHTVVRVRDAAAAPPFVRAERLSPAVCRVHYTSTRRLCAVARGLIRGVAHQRRELVKIRELSCMLQGDAECCLEVELASLPA